MAWLPTLSGSTNPMQARFPIAVDNTSGASGNADVTVTIPVTLAEFWERVDASGVQVRVTDADGVTAVSYKWSAFTLATKTATLEIHGSAGSSKWSAAASAVPILWLYVGDPDATSGATGTTIGGSPLTGAVTAEAPTKVIDVSPPAPGRERPAAARSQASTERRGYWFNLTPALRPSTRTSDAHSEHEELDHIEVSTTTGGSSASLEVEGATRVQYNLGTYVRAVVTGGTDGSDYTLIVRCRTTVPGDSDGFQIIEGRALIQIRDADDA